jgi:uncharacterized membrane protein YkvA (DUF1232 family)
LIDFVNLAIRDDTAGIEGNSQGHPGKFLEGWFVRRNSGMILKSLAHQLKARIRFYRQVQQDPRTPTAARILLGLALAYALSPVDVIPDFIPVIGYLDDVLVVGVLVMLATRLVPREVWEDNRIG